MAPSRLARRLTLGLVPFLILLAGWGISGWILVSLLEARERNDRNNFAQLAANAEDAVEARLEDYLQEMRAAGSFIVSSDHVSRAEWRNFTLHQHLATRYTGIQGLGWVVPVPTAQLPQFLDDARRDGAPEFALRWFAPVDELSPEDHYVVLYLEPQPRNSASLGLVLSSHPLRRQVADRARDTGRPLLTPNIQLYQDRQRRPAALVLYPVYRDAADLSTIEERRAAHLGWVTAPFVIEAFMREALGRRAEKAHLFVFSGEVLAPERLVFSSGLPALPSEFERTRALTLGGQPFTFGWVRTSAFVPSPLSPLLWTAASLALATVLLAAFVAVLQNTGRNAKRLALRRTAELAEARADLEEVNRLQRAVLDGSNYSIISTSIDGVVQTFNSGAENMLGYTRDEVIGRIGPERFHDPAEIAAHAAVVTQELGRPISAGFAAFVARLERVRVTEREWTYIRKDGSRLPVWLAISALQDEVGGTTGYLGVAVDITERKELLLKLEQARDQALEASRLKSEFLANMSHEIRTPMNGIMGVTRLLMNTTLTREQRGLTKVVQSSADNLLTIINDILDFSKVEAGKLRIDPAELDLHQLAEETLTLLAPAARAKGLELILDWPPEMPSSLRGDPTRIRQVLTNLVGNAVKFTERGEITVAARTIASTPACLTFRIDVTDTGPGIPAAQQSRLFEAFTQADSTITRRHGGTGLGLAISRQLVRLMEGEIGFSSKEGTGSTFWFQLTLPWVEPQRPELPPLPAHLRVLVVEDGEASRRSLQRKLSRLGATCDGVAEARAALEELRTAAASGTPFTVVLLDWDLPEGGGRAVAEAIFRDPRLAEVAVVALTATEDAVSAADAAQLSLAGLVVKPVRQPMLHRALARCLEPARRLSRSPTADGTPAAMVTPLKVLIVEDNAANQIVAQGLLTHLGHHTTLAHHGGEALVQLAREDFDVVLMDCQMPVMDGYTATQRIRSGAVEGINPRIPVIALTAYAMPSDRLRCLAAGMDDYVAKPLNVEEISAALFRCGLRSAVPTTTPPPLPPDEPGPELLNGAQLQQLRELKGRQRATLLADYLHSFLQQTPTTLTQLAELAEQQNRDELVMVAHRLAGNCANLGARTMRAVALALEAAARDGRWADVRDQQSELDQEWERVRLPLERILANETSGI